MEKLLKLLGFYKSGSGTHGDAFSRRFYTKRHHYELCVRGQFQIGALAALRWGIYNPRTGKKQRQPVTLIHLLIDWESERAHEEGKAKNVILYGTL